MIWKSNNPSKTAQELVEKMLLEPSYVNKDTALSITFKPYCLSAMNERQEKIKKLLEVCIEIEK